MFQYSDHTDDNTDKIQWIERQEALWFQVDADAKTGIQFPVEMTDVEEVGDLKVIALKVNGYEVGVVVSPSATLVTYDGGVYNLDDFLADVSTEDVCRPTGGAASRGLRVLAATWVALNR